MGAHIPCFLASWYGSSLSRSRSTGCRSGADSDHPAQQVALQEMVLAGRHAVERAARLTAGVEDPGPDWRLGPVVEALQALRGAALIRAVTFMAGIGDVR